MTDQPNQEQIDQFHRRFAAECNNHAWDLASKPERTPDEDREMLVSAYAAAYHWSKIGTALNDARSDITLAHVLSLLGDATDALAFARRSLAYFEQGEGEDWDLAFAHMEMALAAAVASDEQLHSEHYARASEIGQAIKDEEDRKVFLEEFVKIPNRVLPV